MIYNAYILSEPIGRNSSLTVRFSKFVSTWGVQERRGGGYRRGEEGEGAVHERRGGVGQERKGRGRKGGNTAYKGGGFILWAIIYN